MNSDAKGVCRILYGNACTTGELTDHCNTGLACDNSLEESPLCRLKVGEDCSPIDSVDKLCVTSAICW